MHRVVYYCLLCLFVTLSAWEHIWGPGTAAYTDPLRYIPHPVPHPHSKGLLG